jgi:transcriptional regulator with XRE-family HTH domain
VVDDGDDQKRALIAFLRYRCYAIAMSPGTVIRTARREAGLSQAQLAERLATTQSAVARLERPDSNPRIETLDAALRAVGRRLALQATPVAAGLDEDQIRARLALTPAERLQAFQASQRSLGRLTRRARRVPRTSG